MGSLGGGRYTFQPQVPNVGSLGSFGALAWEVPKNGLKNEVFPFTSLSVFKRFQVLVFP